MKKSSISGWKDVFTFTLTETLKNRAYRISFLILALIALVTLPLVQYFTSDRGKDSNEASPVKKVYIQNETSLAEPDFTGVKQEKAFQNINFISLTEDYDTVAKRIEDSERDSVILTIKEQNGSYVLDFAKAGKGSVKDGSIQALAEELTRQFDIGRMSDLGVTAEQNELIHAQVETRTVSLDSQGNIITETNSTISLNEYWFIYGILFFLMMVVMMASSQVASSVVTEKSSRIVEYLLISVKPLALIVGKVLAMLSAVLIQILSMMLLMFISNKIAAGMTSGEQAGVLNQYVPDNIFQNINPLNIILCLILIALGMIFYAVLAGMAGATVSKMEELNEGMTLLTVVTIVGVYIGVGAANVLMGSGSNPYVYFAFLFPLSSPFILPGAILIGKANFIIAIGAIILQLLMNVFMFRFVAGIYETLILHNGNRIKVKDLLGIKKKGVKA